MKHFILLILASFAVHAQDPMLPANSLYHLKSEWKTQDGESLTLRKLRGQDVIITMVYTGCAHACPMMISKIQEIEARLSKLGKSDYKIVLASFDTVKDTPTALKAYVKSRGLDEKKWLFLSTSKDATARELAVVLGISYKPIGGGDFSHSNVITYLDASGVASSRLESLTADSETFVASMLRGLNENP